MNPGIASAYLMPTDDCPREVGRFMSATMSMYSISSSNTRATTLEMKPKTLQKRW